MLERGCGRSAREGIQMNQHTGRMHRRVGGLAGLAGTLTLAGVVLTAQAASAAGNTNFEGILAASSPTGFMSSPNAYDLSDGSVTVTFDVQAWNLTDQGQTVALNFSADHILTDNGQNVADGQPGQAGIAFAGPSGTTQTVMPGTQSFNKTWDANGSQELQLSYTFTSCGYFQLDVWAPWKGHDTGRTRATLASGFVRILGCETNSTPSPTPTDPGASSSPQGGVLGITTPSTGAGGGWLTMGALLMVAGAGTGVVGVRRRRIDI